MLVSFWCRWRTWRSWRFSHVQPSSVLITLVVAAILGGAARPAAAQAGNPPTFVDNMDPTVVAVRGQEIAFWRQAVRPGANPASTDLRVTLDARPLGGGYAAPFADQAGACTDAAADNVFYSCVAVPLNAPLGLQWLTLTVRDAQGRSSTKEVRVLVVDSPTDLDGDGLPDSWEVLFGLSSTSADSYDGATGDPDGDGQTNLQEFLAGTHPHGVPAQTRYFAEAAASAFFATRVTVFNPGATTAHVNLLLLGANGRRTSVYDPAILLASNTSITFRLDPSVAPDTTFSITLESDALVVADRVMAWDESSQFGYWSPSSDFDEAYGTTLETASAITSTTWYLAEGATGGPFRLYYLLENPGAAAANVTVTYLRAAPLPPIDKTYDVPAAGRRTIDVAAEDPGLAAGDVSAKIASDQPIIVERSMYFSTPSQVFAAGHSGAGVTAPATRWFLAEGATGFFDEFVLIANAEAKDAQVTVKYLLPAGAPISETVKVSAHSRYTIPVNGRFPALSSTPVSVVVESPTVPVIVERVMWWPHGNWYEASLSAGATVTGTKWAIADALFTTDGRQSTYVQIANTESTDGLATVTMHNITGIGPAEITKTVPVAANSRTSVDLRTLLPAGDPRPRVNLPVTVTSNGPQIVVERSIYSTPATGPFWSAGAAALATRLP